MKKAELAKQTESELKNTISKERQLLLDGVVEYKTKEVKNVRSLRVHKKNIARALTYLRAHELAKEEK